MTQLKSLTPTLLLLVAFVVATAGFVASHEITSARNTVTLPLEVMGPDGTIESLSLNVSNASAAQTLWMRAHSIGYFDFRNYNTSKASVRLNGGAWVDIDNSIVTCEEPEETYGCVSGGYHTIRFSMPLSHLGTLQPGSNTLHFRFNYVAGNASSGYRILDLEIRDGAGQDLIDGTTFAAFDPAAEPILRPNQISQGEALWRQRDLLREFPGAPNTLRAACADCHQKDGKDLKYFGYSNHSIVTRSTFHGLNQDEAEQIASFIRSYRLEHEDGSTLDLQEDADPLPVLRGRLHRAPPVAFGRRTGCPRSSTAHGRSRPRRTRRARRGRATVRE